MSRHPLAAATALAFTLSTPALAADGQLTIYSGDFESVTQSEGQPGGPGFALVDRRIDFDLKSGQNIVSLDGLPRALDANAAKALDLPAVSFDEAGFRYALNHDAMATEKLAEGIRAFAADAVKLEQLMEAA